MQRDLPALEGGSQTNIAKPYLGEGHQVGGDNDIYIPGWRLEADFDVFGPQHQPPVARAAARFGYATEIEANDETLRRYLRWINLAVHTPDEHFGIEVIWTDQALSPALSPDAH